jgi:hypothetical protein
MARNDVILVDGIIDERVPKSLPSPKRDEVFEFFAFEQILKFADLSPDEINSGWVDGGNDGGIDGFFLFVNDHLLSDPATFHWPRGKADVSLWVVTCKHHETFAQVPVDKLVATISELLDFTKRPADLKGGYSREIIQARENFFLCYRTLSTRISKLSVRMLYASTGDTDNIGAAVQARARQAESLVRGLFSNCDAEFRFVGATDLITLLCESSRGCWAGGGRSAQPSSAI